ncbi:chymotrypsin, putative [Pediculus humanus corporis]|uniref:Chymotrypsin, putative n=1 Tax=Pediculus humanus subsp. corporis TaxID=121224 RepID=E0W3U8_PEDHC|nr:chymotrypsin, putative [Pediculus humanus corporis]EEB20304.1 chymotrypsin, putative [Pediculus humanus corporis]
MNQNKTISKNGVGAPKVDLDKKGGFIPHIVGGTPSKVGSYRFMVSLRHKATGDFFCGGSLVDQQFDVVVGVGHVHLDNQTFYEVEKNFPHPDYQLPSTNNDIALMKLKNPVPLSSEVEVIEFPYMKNADNRNVTALGWGRLGANAPISTVLMHLKKKTLDNEECQRRFKPNGSKLHPGHICLGSTPNSGVCFGDSGSPLLLEEDDRNFAVGVVSWGIPCAVGFPDVFSRVSYYSSWLQETMAKNA